MTISEVKRWYRKGKANRYAWPGGYPLYYVTSDGAALCADCMTKERARIIRSTVENDCDGWNVSGQDINWEDPSLYCDHCSKRIESAYAEVEETKMEQDYMAACVKAIDSPMGRRF